MTGSPELIYWGIIPAIISLLILTKSFRLAKKYKSVFQTTCVILNVVFIGFADIVLYGIFFLNYYPAFIPHVVIAISGIILLLQYLRIRFKKRD